MILNNPKPELFKEIENFLSYYYNHLDILISIYERTRPIEIYGRSNYILYNTEQLSRPNIKYWATECKNDNRIIEIWDYSIANINFWNSLDIFNVRHVPLKIWPNYKKILLDLNKINNYKFDVAFVGWVSQRRQNIINNLIDNGISVNVLTNTYGIDRDIEISKCKILLNIHFDNTYQIFESVRCFPWLDIGKIVISENSLDNDIRCINVEYDNIIDTVRRNLGYV